MPLKKEVDTTLVYQKQFQKGLLLPLKKEVDTTQACQGVLH